LGIPVSITFAVSLNIQVYLEATVCWLFLFQHDKFLSLNMKTSDNMRKSVTADHLRSDYPRWMFIYQV